MDNKEKKIIKCFKKCYNNAENDFNEEYTSGFQYGLIIALKILVKYKFLNKKDINNIFERRIFIDD